MCASGQTISQQTCQRDDNSATIQPGSKAMLGGILSFSSQGSNGFGCGKPSASMQCLEAIRWVLDLLNKKNENLQTEFVTDHYVPGITLGMKVINNCHSHSGAVASIAQVYEGFNGNDAQCTKQTDEVVFGIVGGSSSDQAADLSLALQPHEIPIISYEATAPALTASGMYPNFMRTVAPDSLYAEVIVQAMVKLDWNYITIVYDSGRYGREAYAEVHKKMVASGLCLRAGIAVDGSDLSDDNMDATLNSVLSTKATGIVFFGPEDLAIALVKRAGDRISETGDLQWMITNFPVESSLNIPYMRGLISITLAYRYIVEFEDHWIRIDPANPSPENPWFKDWFEDKNACSFNPTGIQKDCDNLYPGKTWEQSEFDRRATYQQDQFVEPAVMAVFTYAKALRMAQMDKCTGSQACPELINMDRKEFFENYLKKVDFIFTSDERVPSLASKNILPYDEAKHLSFTSQGDIVNPSFYIWNYNDIKDGRATGNFKFNRIGTFINNYLDFNIADVAMYNEVRQVRLNPPPKSLCPTQPCSPCLGLPADMKYYYEPGDIVINGIFSLHEKGENPMTCGPLKSPNQVMYMEAMIYAINRINNDNSILSNIKLGGLGIDDCSSKTVGQAFMSQLQRGSLVVHDNSQNPLDPKTIDAYLAAHTSPLTDPMAYSMNYLKRPLVGYRAGSTKLDNTQMYPYFIRSAPYIREEIRALILLLKHQNWMHVQMLTSDSEYAMDAYQLFRDLAAKEDICVVATHNIGSTDDSAKKAIQGLDYNRKVPVTVSLLMEDDQHSVLKALHANANVRGRITLIASSGWGTSKMVVKGMESTAENVITISLRHSLLELFQQYLRTLSATNHDSVDPWFMEWFMAAYQCTSGMQNCDVSKQINDGAMFEMMYQVESVINGVKALARALDRTLQHYCGNGYTVVCSDYTNAADKGLKYMEYLRQVSFQIEGLEPELFKFIGNSPAIPFDVNYFRNGDYVQIGSIKTYEHFININTNSGLPSTVRTSCEEPCHECLYMFNYQNMIHVPGDIMLGAIFNVHYSGNGPFMCGDMRIYNGALYTEAFNFAVNKINSKSVTGINLNTKLGFLGFDGCSNPTRAQAIINRVNSGSMMSGGKAIEFPDIASWVTYDSETTLDSAKFLQQFGMTLVSPAATNPMFDELTPEKFLTLFRTTWSDKGVVEGMVNYVKKMGWKYVFALNSPDAANRESANLFTSLLKDEGICVLAKFEFVTDGSMEVILSSLVSAESQVVAVFAEPDQHIEKFLQTKTNALYRKQLHFIANRAWMPYAKETQYRSMLADSVFFQLAEPTISEYYNYLKNKVIDESVNPWLGEIYGELFDCDYPGFFSDRLNCNSPLSELVVSSKFYQDIYTLSTIDAVYALAKGLDVVLRNKCGNGYTEVCAKFRQDADTQEMLRTQMDQETFLDITGDNFQFLHRKKMAAIPFMRYTSAGDTELEGHQKTTGVLDLDNANTLINRYTNIKSACTGDCLVCQDTDNMIQDFSFIPGDVYIIGLFDVHKNGPTPFTCGGINNKHGVQLLEAFHFALDYVNNHMGIFKELGIQIGGIGLDMCQSATRAANIVANIHSGKVTLRKSGTTISPRQIDAYIATMDTESSIRVGDILNQLLIPQISYGASGMELLDREKYGYFLRSVPADDKMGRAIISYLKKFEYNNIQVVKSFDEVGEPGAAEFERLAEINLVCITKTYLIGEYGNLEGDSSNVIQKIVDESNAQVVVLWMKDPVPFLKVLNSYEAAYKNTLFVATDKWGADPDYLKIAGIQNVLKAKNLILLDVETADVPGFDHFLAEKTPDNYIVNPWYKEYFEMAQGCDWDTGTCNQYKTIPRLDNYVQDPYVLYVVNAVFSAAKGIEGAINALCEGERSGVCNQYDTSGVRRQRVLDHVKEVNFIDDTHQPFFYTPDGQSDRGFHFYNVTKEAPNLEYENVGSYNDSHFMKLDITYDNEYNALCDPLSEDVNLVDCVCPFKPDIPTRFMKKADGGRGITLVYIGDIHQPHPTSDYRCGDINTGSDLHRMLAFFYAIERINSNADLELPDSIRLDGVALDSCSTSLRLGQDVYNILSGNPLCDTDEGPVVSPNSVAAVIVDKDKNALPVSTMLSPKGITSISPTATDSSLDDPYLHRTFLRTQGSDRDNVRVILDVAERLKWNMLGVIYTDTPALSMAKDMLLRESKNRASTMCVGTMAKLAVSASEEDIHHALDDITQQFGVNSVVLLVTPEHFRHLMESSQEMGTPGITWIVASNWASVEEDIQKYKSELSSSIWIQSNTSALADFDRYVKSITLENRMGIPNDWFDEIYETIHKCKILDFEDRTTRLYTNICTGKEKITDDMLSTNDPSILHVIISVYAAALGLNNVPQCSGTSLDISACLQVQELKNQLIYDGIRGVRFQVLPELLGNKTFQFAFSRDGNGEADYVITSRNENGQPIRIGGYTVGGLTFDEDAYKQTTSFDEEGLPTSNCAPGATCQCYGLHDIRYSFSPENVDDLANVVAGKRYRDPKSGNIILVQDVPEASDRLNDIWALIVLCLAILGAVVALGLFAYLLVMYPVRGGTSILGYITSFGIVLLYLMVIPFIYHADVQVCAIRRFLLGVVYAIVYSALLVKLVDCCRVRKKGDNAKYSKMGRPVGLFFVTVFLVLVQCMINAEWLILEEPAVERVFYNDMYWPRCAPEDFHEEGLVLSLCYVMVLMFVCFCMGIYTFTLKVNHKESRWIFGVIILSIPCWIIWCAVSILGPIKVRDAAVAVGLLINATFVLLLMPVRKLYLLNKYNRMIEEEDKQMIAEGQSQYDGSVYGRQYDNQPQMHVAGSVRGSSVAYSTSRVQHGARAY